MTRSASSHPTDPLGSGARRLPRGPVPRPARPLAAVTVPPCAPASAPLPQAAAQREYPSTCSRVSRYLPHPPLLSTSVRSSAPTRIALAPVSARALPRRFCRSGFPLLSPILPRARIFAQLGQLFLDLAAPFLRMRVRLFQQRLSLNLARSRRSPPATNRSAS